MFLFNIDFKDVVSELTLHAESKLIIFTSGLFLFISACARRAKIKKNLWDQANDLANRVSGCDESAVR